MKYIYYTENPKGTFKAESDAEALLRSKALVIYRENLSTMDGRPFIMLREETKK